MGKLNIFEKNLKKFKKPIYFSRKYDIIKSSKQINDHQKGNMLLRTTGGAGSIDNLWSTN